MEEVDFHKGRECLKAIQAYLVPSIDLRAVSKWKLPSLVRVLRESLLWRVEELARNAFETLDLNKFVASALAARAVMETTAALVFLDTLILRAIEKGVTEELIEKMDRFLINSKIWEELEDPIHVNDMLREVEKVIPGFFETHYATLSELAHPNWAGTLGAFGEFDQETFRAIFATGGRSPENQRKKIGHNLSASLGIAKGYYEMIDGKLLAFAQAVDQFYIQNPPPSEAAV